MTDALERLSLEEVEALVSDVLARAGADADAAAAVGQMVRMAESADLPHLGLERVPDLVAQLRSGGIDGRTTANHEEPRPGMLRLQMGQGLTDAALVAWGNQLVSSARNQGVAVLALSGGGDLPDPALWATAFALRGMATLTLPDAASTQSGVLALPRSKGNGPLLRFDLGEPETVPWAAALTAIAADTLPYGAPVEFGTPHNAALCVIAVAPGAGASAIAEVMARRHPDSAVTVEGHDTVVQSSLLAQIINA